MPEAEDVEMHIEATEPALAIDLVKTELSVALSGAPVVMVNGVVLNHLVFSKAT